MAFAQCYRHVTKYGKLTGMAEMKKASWLMINMMTDSLTVKDGLTHMDVFQEKLTLNTVYNYYNKLHYM